MTEYELPICQETGERSSNSSDMHCSLHRFKATSNEYIRLPVESQLVRRQVEGIFCFTVTNIPACSMKWESSAECADMCCKQAKFLWSMPVSCQVKSCPASCMLAATIMPPAQSSWRLWASPTSSVWGLSPKHTHLYLWCPTSNLILLTTYLLTLFLQRCSILWVWPDYMMWPHRLWTCLDVALQWQSKSVSFPVQVVPRCQELYRNSFVYHTVQTSPPNFEDCFCFIGELPQLPMCRSLQSIRSSNVMCSKNIRSWGIQKYFTMNLLAFILHFPPRSRLWLRNSLQSAFKHQASNSCG